LGQVRDELIGALSHCPTRIGRECGARAERWRLRGLQIRPVNRVKFLSIYASCVDGKRRRKKLSSAKSPIGAGRGEA
ncbi:MAG: hypothetical protein U1A81_11325, partial [Hydrogenophaga sp.]|nr:hypothetical protein [Hydrogenophaga sp.]